MILQDDENDPDAVVGYEAGEEINADELPPVLRVRCHGHRVVALRRVNAKISAENEDERGLQRGKHLSSSVSFLCVCCHLHDINHINVCDTVHFTAHFHKQHVHTLYFIMLVVLILPVCCYILLNCEYFIYLRFCLFVIHVCHPHFSLSGIKKY